MEEQRKNDISFDELDEAEAYAYKNIFIFDKSDGKSVEVTVGFNKEMETQAINNLSDIDKVLEELVNRKDIKSLSINININDKSEVYKSNKDLGISIEDTVRKIKEVIKDFKDIVIVYSREELDALQKQFREEHGLDGHNIPSKLDEANKEYKDIRADFIKQIKNNENISKGYIRISNEDFASLGNIIEDSHIPYLSKNSEIKDGVNIIVPINKMDMLKDVFMENEIECKQIVHGNIDWHNIKDTKNVYEYVTKEELLKFQELNNDKFRYIAFENKGKFAIYLQSECDIPLLGRKKNFNKINSNKKTMNEVKTQVENQKQSFDVKQNNEKIKVEKER